MRVNVSVRSEDSDVWKAATEIARARRTSMSALIIDCLRAVVSDSTECENCHGKPPAGFACRSCGADGTEAWSRPKG